MFPYIMHLCDYVHVQGHETTTEVINVSSQVHSLHVTHAQELGKGHPSKNTHAGVRLGQFTLLEFRACLFVYRGTYP